MRFQSQLGSLENAAFPGLLGPLCIAFSLTSDAAFPQGPWQPLFKGKDLSGWTLKCKPEDTEKGFFRVEDGCIVADSIDKKEHDYVWLVSNEVYRDFHLKLKFKRSEDSPGNSGIQIRSRYDDQEFWMDGPQVDIHPPGPYRIGLIYDETRGVRKWLHPDLPKGKQVDATAYPNVLFHESPDWNELEIRAEGLRISTFLNGIKVSDFDGTGILDDETHKSRNVGENGQIAIQIHRNHELMLRFKDIEIRELD
jgi:hypothetical protein